MDDAGMCARIRFGQHQVSARTLPTIPPAQHAYTPPVHTNTPLSEGTRLVPGAHTTSTPPRSNLCSVAAGAQVMVPPVVVCVCGTRGTEKLLDLDLLWIWIWIWMCPHHISWMDGWRKGRIPPVVARVCVWSHTPSSVPVPCAPPPPHLGRVTRRRPWMSGPVAPTHTPPPHWGHEARVRGKVRELTHRSVQRGRTVGSRQTLSHTWRVGQMRPKASACIQNQS